MIAIRLTETFRSLRSLSPLAQTYQKEPATLPTDTSSSVSNQQSTSNSHQPPPAYSQSAAHNITQNELQKRQEELERKAAELAAKEEALRNLEGTVKPPNWPPVPSFCPFGPCFYQDINVEIAPEFQKIVRYAYYLWMCKSRLEPKNSNLVSRSRPNHATSPTAFVLVLFINMLGNLVLATSLGGYLTELLSSIVSIIIFTPAAYLCWFRPLYKAFKYVIQRLCFFVNLQTSVEVPESRT